MPAAVCVLPDPPGRRAVHPAGDNRSQLNQPVGEATVVNLEIEMNPRAVIPDLLVDVGVALRWGKAAEFRVPGPRLTERPAQRR